VPICLAAAATLDALADGTLLDKHGEPLVFRRRRLQESYASRHKLEIVLGTLISFMVVKICEHLFAVPRRQNTVPGPQHVGGGPRIRATAAETLQRLRSDVSGVAGAPVVAGPQAHDDG
jgi:hypothetical protein